MKISNETKVGALTSIAIVFLILGFNFLKGKSLFKHGNFIYAKFKDAKDVKPSYSVMVNGYQVGSVYEVTPSDRLDEILVSIKLNNDEYKIPQNSIATIDAGLGLSSPIIKITPGDKWDALLKSGDTILTASDKGMLGDIQSKIGPLSDKLSAAASSLDSLLRNFNRTLDEGTRANLQSAMANINRISSSMVLSAGSLQRMLAEQGSLAQSLDNMKAFTNNLNTNNDKINATIGNLQKTTDNLAEADIKGTIANLKSSVDKLNTAIDSKDGSLGLLLNDKQFYNNLVSTSRSANILLDDLRVNPKRYVNLSFSLFGGGKKSQGDYLKQPLPQPDSTRSK
jgi:phospholipid/cholesterol/gamma-HCH transport system substrate-binding protein